VGSTGVEVGIDVGVGVAVGVEVDVRIWVEVGGAGVGLEGDEVGVGGDVRSQPRAGARNMISVSR
jgi:hypothetical protein